MEPKIFSKLYPNHSITPSGKIWSNVTDSFLKTAVDYKGYEHVKISNKNIRQTFRIHRLVAEAFIPNPENKEQVNHIDGNKLNNHVLNLEWCTQQENQNHAVKNGLKYRKISNDLAIEIYRQKGAPYEVLSKKYNLAKNTIYFIVCAKRRFKFLNQTHD